MGTELVGCVEYQVDHGGSEDFHGPDFPIATC